MSAPDPAALELLRAKSGLSIDAEGRLCHAGEPITHRRTLEVLWRSLSREPDGRYAVRVGRELGYVAVEDAPYAVRGLTAAGDELLLHLSDGSAEPLDPATLTVGGEGVLRCRVKQGQHRARFLRGAQVSLGLLLDEEAGGEGQFTLRLGGRSYTLSEER